MASLSWRYIPVYRICALIHIASQTEGSKKKAFKILALDLPEHVHF
jgi:hypothetical protein